MIDDEILVPVVHRTIAPVVDLARQFGPLPPLRSPEYLDAPDVVRLAVLLVAGEAWAITGDPVKAAIRAAASDVREAADWPALIKDHVPHEELERRRARPVSAARCLEDGCRAVVTVAWQPPEFGTLRCPRHREAAA